VNSGGKKLAYNVVGTVVGAVLAGLAIFGIVSYQNGVDTPQTNQQVINYNS